MHDHLPYETCLFSLGTMSVDSWTKGYANGDMPRGAVFLLMEGMRSWNQLSLVMSHGCTTMILKENKPVQCGNRRVHQHQKRLKLFHLQGRRKWSHFLTNGIIYQHAVPPHCLLQLCTTRQGWLNCRSILQRNGHNFIGLDGDFIMTTHGLMLQITSCSVWLNLTLPLYCIPLPRSCSLWLLLIPITKDKAPGHSIWDLWSSAQEKWGDSQGPDKEWPTSCVRGMAAML